MNAGDVALRIVAKLGVPVDLIDGHGRQAVGIAVEELDVAQRVDDVARQAHAHPVGLDGRGVAVRAGVGAARLGQQRGAAGLPECRCWSSPIPGRW